MFTHTLRLILIVVGAFALPAKLVAHEFWISPQSYNIAPEDPIRADLRVGQDFKAPAYAYIDFQIVRFELWQNGEKIEVTGQMGDVPALNMEGAVSDGLVTIVHETADSTLTWDEWETFERFVNHKDLTGTFEEHARLGLPRDGFKESYRRFAKSLVAVGGGAGSDIEAGLRTEIIALTNPYTDDLSGGMRVRLMFEGAPRADAQIEVFEKAADETLTVFTVRTDADGIATVPVKPGHEYMLDAVKMLTLPEPVDLEKPVFASLWANLTFKTPG